MAYTIQTQYTTYVPIPTKYKIKLGHVTIDYIGIIV